MAKRKNAKRNDELEGAGEFAGPDAEKEAIEKIAQAKAAAEKEAEQDKKGDNGGPIMDRDAWRRAANESIAEDLEIERLQESIAECRGRLSSIRKVAKSCGVDWDVVKDYRKIQKRIRKGEMGAIVTEHRRLGELMGIMDCPLYTQFDLFKLPAEQLADDNKQPAMEAELAGQHAYSQGAKLTDNPFNAATDTEKHNDWHHGWVQAQNHNARAMAPTH